MARVLVVDDNADERLIYSAVLTHHGHEVEEAGDGVGAIELAQSLRPDVIVMDVHMPVMDGLLASRAIRGNTTTATIPIVCVTGYDIFPSEASAAGCTKFLRKPVPPRLLLDVVAEMIHVSSDSNRPDLNPSA
jgi:two-component system, cell cycle response regulator DivK